MPQKTLAELKAALNKVENDKEAGEKLIEKGNEAKKAIADLRKQTSQMQRAIIQVGAAHEKATLSAARTLFAGDKRGLVLRFDVEAPEAIQTNLEKAQIAPEVGENGGRLVIRPEDLDEDGLRAFQEVVDKLEYLCSGRQKKALNQVNLVEGRRLKDVDGVEPFYEVMK